MIVKNASGLFAPLLTNAYKNFYNPFVSMQPNLWPKSTLGPLDPQKRIWRGISMVPTSSPLKITSLYGHFSPLLYNFWYPCKHEVGCSHTPPHITMSSQSVKHPWAHQREQRTERCSYLCEGRNCMNSKGSLDWNKEGSAMPWHQKLKTRHSQCNEKLSITQQIANANSSHVLTIKGIKVQLTNFVCTSRDIWNI